MIKVEFESQSQTAAKVIRVSDTSGSDLEAASTASSRVRRKAQRTLKRVLTALRISGQGEIDRLTLEQIRVATLSSVQDSPQYTAPGMRIGKHDDSLAGNCNRRHTGDL